MSQEKITEIMKTLDRLPEMDQFSKGIMAGYILAIKATEEKNKNKEDVEQKDITKN